MNNLELKSIGVQELDTQEMVQVEGGSEFSNWTWRQLGISF